MVVALSIRVWIWNIETCQSFQEEEWEKKENNGGDKSNQSTIYAYINITMKLLHNYHILIETFFKRNKAAINI
jgi:hypothetical protein